MSEFVKWLLGRFKPSPMRLAVGSSDAEAVQAGASDSAPSNQIAALASTAPQPLPPMFQIYPSPASGAPELRRVRPFLLAARLRCVAKLNPRRKFTRTTGQPNRRATKRSPHLFPVKSKAVVRKRAKTKIIVAKPQRMSAVILRLPLASSKATHFRLKRVA